MLGENPLRGGDTTERIREAGCDVFVSLQEEHEPRADYATKAAVERFALPDLQPAPSRSRAVLRCLFVACRGDAVEVE